MICCDSESGKQTLCWIPDSCIPDSGKRTLRWIPGSCQVCQVSFCCNPDSGGISISVAVITLEEYRKKDTQPPG